jgi:isopentenyldiphosphate isomerase
VFSSDGKLLLQRRSEKKKIGRLQWDLSLAEHLTPGESFREAVVRGLREELGLSLEDIVGEGSGECSGAGAGAGLVAKNDVHRRELHGFDSLGNEFHDVELVQSFFCRSALDAEMLAGMVSFDDGEVSEVVFIRPEALAGMFERDPEGYTAWLRAESACVGLVGG